MLNWKAALGHSVAPATLALVIYILLYDRVESIALDKTLKFVDSIWAWVTWLIAHSGDGKRVERISVFLNKLPNSESALLYSCWLWFLVISICIYAFLIRAIWTDRWRSVWTEIRKVGFIGTSVHKLYQNGTDWERKWNREKFINEIEETVEQSIKKSSNESSLDKIRFAIAYFLDLRIRKVLLIGLYLLVSLLMLPIMVPIVAIFVVLGPPVAAWHFFGDGDWRFALLVILIYVAAWFGLAAAITIPIIFIYVANVGAMVVAGIALRKMSDEYGFTMNISEKSVMKAVEDLVKSDPHFRRKLNELG